MADLSLDLTKGSATYKDLLVVDNDLILTSDANPMGTNNVEQDILQNLSMVQGEWFMDNTVGVPYYSQILVKNPDQSKIEAIVMNTILSTPGVTQLVYFKVTVNSANRFLQIDFSCLTTSGKVTYSGPVGG